MAVAGRENHGWALIDTDLGWGSHGRGGGKGISPNGALHTSLGQSPR